MRAQAVRMTLMGMPWAWRRLGTARRVGVVPRGGEGGDLAEEIAESGLKAKVTDLSDFFTEEFYETKKVVFVAAK